MATATGKRIVEMVWEDLKPRDILTAQAFDNVVTTVLALSGSTNAIIHLIAMARRASVPLDLERFDELSRRTPVLCNLRPSGKYLTEDFYYAGGLRALLWRIKNLLALDCVTANGRTLGENLAGAEVHNPEVILSPEKPLVPAGGLVVLRGNLCPDGAVIKPCCGGFRRRRAWSAAFRGPPSAPPPEATAKNEEGFFAHRAVARRHEKALFIVRRDCPPGLSPQRQRG